VDYNCRAIRYAASTVKIPYSRPKTLSDPYSDFSPEELEQLLAVPDDKLEWHHLRNLLGPFLPAGTYQESVYFLPLAFEFLRRQDDSLDLTTSVTWFISEHADHLAKDNLLGECRSEIERCLLHWTGDFAVKHFDRDGCAAKGWRLVYFDYVRGSATVCETLCDLHRFKRHADLADHFITLLALSTSAASSGWFLELARAQNDVYRPPRREVFQRYFSDTGLLARKAAIVRQHLAAKTASPTYWQDVFSRLGLVGDEEC
jgi:hypothetical protein